MGLVCCSGWMRRRPVWVWVVAGLGFLVLVCAAFGVGSMFVPDDDPSAKPPVDTSVTTSASATAAPVDPGVPPEPDAVTAAAFIADLDAIDLAIVGGKPDRAIDRARNQCSSVREWPNDQAKLVSLTSQRFTSPSNPEGFGSEKSARILAAVRKHICPSY